MKTSTFPQLLLLTTGLVLSALISASTSSAGTRRIENNPIFSQAFGYGPSAPNAFPRDSVWYPHFLYDRDVARATAQGYQWIGPTWGNLYYAPTRIFVKNDLLAPFFTRAFVATLASEKRQLMHLLGLRNREYNRLALLAFGISGRETRFATSPTYFFKENAQWYVTAHRVVEATFMDRNYDGRNSRGPTQIKRVPDNVRRAYNIDENHLNSPRNAAIATMSFLGQTLNEMKIRARDTRRYGFLNSETIYDYVLYGYFGGLRRMINRGNLAPGFDLNSLSDREQSQYATPETNIYIQIVRRNVLWLSIFEMPGVPPNPR